MRALSATLKALASREPPGTTLAEVMGSAAERLAQATNLAQVNAALDDLDDAVRVSRVGAADGPRCRR